MAQRRLRKRISDVKIREDALAEATTLKDLVAREANELADIVYQAIADDPDEDLDEGPDDEPNEDLRRLIHRSMVLDEMTWPIDLIIHGLRSKVSKRCMIRILLTVHRRSLTYKEHSKKTVKIS
jgi:hypothetical protein